MFLMVVGCGFFWEEGVVCWVLLRFGILLEDEVLFLVLLGFDFFFLILVGIGDGLVGIFVNSNFNCLVGFW